MAEPNPFPAEFSVQTVDPSRLQTILDPLTSNLARYQEWVSQHGYQSVAAIEAFLNSIDDDNRNLGDWVREHCYWMEHADAVDSGLCSLVDVLEEAQRKIFRTMPHDPTIPAGNSPKFVRISASMEPFKFEDVVVSQLKMAAETVAALATASGTEEEAQAVEDQDAGKGIGEVLAGNGDNVSTWCQLTDAEHPQTAEVEQVSELRVFTGGELVFYADHVELCGVTICGGPRCEQARKTLDLLRQKNSKGRFAAFPSKKLAERISREKGAPSVPGLIRDLRARIVAVLRQNDIQCHRNDVIERTDHGYHFRDWIIVQNGDPIKSPAIEGHEDRAYLDDVPVDVPVDSHDDDPVSDKSADAAAARRKWILEQVTKGRRMRAPGFATELGCSDRTVKRDIDVLEDQIEFVGSPRSGYYQLRTPPEPSQ